MDWMDSRDELLLYASCNSSDGEGVFVHTVSLTPLPESLPKAALHYLPQKKKRKKKKKKKNIYIFKKTKKTRSSSALSASKEKKMKKKYQKNTPKNSMHESD